jgi:hypothetical protein
MVEEEGWFKLRKVFSKNTFTRRWSSGLVEEIAATRKFCSAIRYGFPFCAFVDHLCKQRARALLKCSPASGLLRGGGKSDGTETSKRLADLLEQK